MQLDGRRESSNVDDRRRLSGGTKAGLGLGGIVIVGLLTLMMGGDLGDVFRIVAGSGGLQTTTTQTSTREFTAQEQELATFAKRILASTEDVWTAEFAKYGLNYQAPTMVLYSGATTSGCGSATSSVGPFYCSADQCLYIDLSFFSSMKKQLGADGDFAYAYVIAHEVGHHVQHLLGTLGQAHQQMARMSTTESNKMSVRIELQADYYAGVWGYHENDMYKSLDDGDLREAIDCAEVIGDNYLQKKAGGTVQPDLFTHGTSAQRMKWLKAGLTSGDIRGGDTFSCNYNQL